jgi:hypothetical protein
MERLHSEIYDWVERRTDPMASFDNAAPIAWRLGEYFDFTTPGYY